MKLVSYVCPKCGAPIYTSILDQSIRCEYCGTHFVIEGTYQEKLEVEKENLLQIKKNKEKELQEIKRKEFEKAAEERRRKLRDINSLKVKYDAETKTIKKWMAGIMGLLSLIALLSGDLFPMLFINIILLVPLIGCSVLDDKKKKYNDKRAEILGMIQFPRELIQINENREFTTDVCQKLKHAGFINIKEEPLYDLIAGVFIKPYSVKNITINSNPPNGDEWYEPNVQIVIYYHDFRR